MPSRILRDELDKEAWAAFIAAQPCPVTVTLEHGEGRTLSQNALVHKWYGEIAKQTGDRTAAQVKGQCHLEYGVPIKMRDPSWAWVWAQISKRLDYEQQCKVFEKGILAMTRVMTVKELTEYMDAVSQAYRAQGIRLTDPEEMKYQDAFR